MRATFHIGSFASAMVFQELSKVGRLTSVVSWLVTIRDPNIEKKKWNLQEHKCQINLTDHHRVFIHNKHRQKSGTLPILSLSDILALHNYVD